MFEVFMAAMLFAITFISILALAWYAIVLLWYGLWLVVHTKK